MSDESSRGADAPSDAQRASVGAATLVREDPAALDRRFEEFKSEAQRSLALLDRMRAAQTARLLRAIVR